MEIGYLAPPVATNLFVASALFKKPFGQVSRAIMPGLGLTTAALVVFMFVPTCSKGLVNVQRGVDFYEPFPWDGKRVHAGGPGERDDLGEISTKATTEAGQDKQKLNGMGDEYYGLPSQAVDAAAPSDAAPPPEVDAADDLDLNGVQL